uniref:Uncharacterized protein n=1 Tax=Arion vulgaris TaxID=1028688 RepID=A0A0B7B4P9_9EUPU
MAHNEECGQHHVSYCFIVSLEPNLKMGNMRAICGQKILLQLGIKPRPLV